MVDKFKFVLNGQNFNIFLFCTSFFKRLCIKYSDVVYHVE